MPRAAVPDFADYADDFRAGVPLLQSAALGVDLVELESSHRPVARRACAPDALPEPLAQRCAHADRRSMPWIRSRLSAVDRAGRLPRAGGERVRSAGVTKSTGCAATVPPAGTAGDGAARRDRAGTPATPGRAAVAERGGATGGPAARSATSRTITGCRSSPLMGRPGCASTTASDAGISQDLQRGGKRGRPAGRLDVAAPRRHRPRSRAEAARHVALSALTLSGAPCGRNTTYRADHQRVDREPDHIPADDGPEPMSRP